MPKTQATRVGARTGALLTAFLLAALHAVAAGDTFDAEAKCAGDTSRVSLGVSMITTGKKITPGFKGQLEDPFSQLSEDSDESLLSVDEAQDPLTETSSDVPEAAPAEAAAPTRGALAPLASELFRRLLPSGLVLLLAAGTGILFSFLMDSVIHKDVLKPLKKDAFPLQGSYASTPPASPTDDIAEKADSEESMQRPPKAMARELEEEDEYGCTALHYAADRGDVERVRDLLQRGACVDRREAWDETALHFAARNGSVEVCELLLAHGAELNPVNESCCTPLLVAAQAGKEAACKLLLERGAHAGGKCDNELPPVLSALMVERIFAEVEAAEPAAADATEL